ncbi:dynein light chain Tctex-type 1, partial [Syncephalis pseudoplumigaleata]
EDVLSGEHYQHSRVSGWNAAIVERSLVKLGELKMAYKYIVTCAILQRTDAGVHAATACYWDNTRDGHITYKYESKSMHAIVNAFCLAV